MVDTTASAAGQRLLERVRRLAAFVVLHQQPTGGRLGPRDDTDTAPGNISRCPESRDC
jgi:hypothetical protein